jgi:hypothetical protein
MTRETGVAAVLPEIASVDFDAKKIIGKGCRRYYRLADENVT